MKLASTETILEVHDGDRDIQNAEGVGTIVALTLPPSRIAKPGSSDPREPLEKQSPKFAAIAVAAAN